MASSDGIDLIWLSTTQPAPGWPLGKVLTAEPTPGAVHRLIQQWLPLSQAQAWLFWSPLAGIPDPQTVAECMNRPGDVWHAGLRLGTAGMPRLIDFVSPTWMLNLDPPSDIEASSWRLSLNACLVRTDVLRQMGDIHPDFKTIDAAALEMGHRYVMRGVVTRHIPWLVSAETPPISIDEVSLEDQFRFLRSRYKRIWSTWAATRLALSNPSRLFQVLRAYQHAAECQCNTCYFENTLFKRDLTTLQDKNLGITVIIPTRCRYAYLGKCLETLRRQSVRIEEIICVDQNQPHERNYALYENFRDLPLRVIWQNASGQSVARNAALKEAKTDWIFFADDDSEYPPDTLEQHLRLILTHQATGSTGISLPPHEYSLPQEYRHARIAYNLDTGNALVKREAVLNAGGFDRNFDFGKGADTDLGMRLYLNGCLIMHNPQAKRLHFKAESGGLRDFGVLWEHRTKSRWQPWPAPTYLYWVMTYFPKHTWRECLLHDCLFRFAAPRGARFRARFWHLFKELLFLPLTFLQVIRGVCKAREYSNKGPVLLKIRPNVCSDSER